MISILVTGAGGGVGQGVIKSLRMIEDLPLRVIGADMSSRAAGLYACDKAYLVTSAADPDYLTSLARIFEAEAIDYYLPGTDVELEFCARNKGEIEEQFGVKVVVNPLETVQIADDKKRTAAFLADQGLPFPETITLREARRRTDLSFPLIVKPAVGYRSIGVVRAESPGDLTAYPGEEGVIVQELVGDANSEFTCTIVGCEGAFSPVLALRRDLRSGDTYRAYPEQVPEVERYVSEVARRIGIEGACNFQLRVGHDGVPKLFEINARFSGTTPLCSQLGFNPVEFYLKRKQGIAYNPQIAWGSAVLRFWSEVVLRCDALDQLEAEGALVPDLAPQFSLYGGDR